MELYNYDALTNEYLSTTNASLDPLETIKQGKDVFLIPANATPIAPSTFETGFSQIFVDDEWQKVVDNRGKKMYRIIDAAEFIVTSINPIPEDFTLLVPCEYPTWDGEKWIVDLEAKKTIENNIVMANLAAIDAKSIRALRAGDMEWITKYEEEAVIERAKLQI